MANTEVFNAKQLTATIALLLVAAGALNVEASCPKSDEICSKYENCLSRVRILKELRETSLADFVSYHNQIQCGKEDEWDLICCDTPEETPATEDVSQHPNLHLLPQDICGPISQDRIVNGNKARLFELPWMALTMLTNGSSSTLQCGASLINDRYVLTAAHCVEYMAPNYVRLGEHNTNTEIDCEENADGEKICAAKHQDIPIEEVIVHPNYLGGSITYNDIAMLRLSHPADITSDAVQPICLPIGLSEQTINLTGKMLDTAGWGVTKEGNRSNELLKASVAVMKSDKCLLWPPSSAVTQICAGAGTDGSNVSHGDSGGPLTYIGEVNGSPRTLQYGIVSAGPGRPNSELGHVYINVGHYMKWILDNMKP